jgi:nucleoside-diphosphate-sugar epimerase
MAEIYVRLFAERCNVAGVVLRYFNVFGPAQSIEGPCAPVIPEWISRLLRGDECVLHGNGTQTRDFVCVSNIVQANLLAAVVPLGEGNYRIYNIGSGIATDLLQLHSVLAAAVRAASPLVEVPALRREGERAGDIHLADRASEPAPPVFSPRQLWGLDAATAGAH